MTASIEMLAMDQSPSIHAPKFKEEVSNFLKTQIQREDSNFCEEVRDGAMAGVSAPWVASAAIGVFGAEGLSKFTSGGTSPLDKAIGHAIGGGVTTILFSPLSLFLSLPSAAIGTLGGMCNYLFKGIAVNLNESEFDQYVALHLYQWIRVIKAGRLAIRADLKAWQKNHEECANSVSAAASTMLQGETFQKYFGELSFDPQEMTRILSQVNPKKNNWNNMFEELSNLVKIPELNADEWLKLEQNLVNFKNKTPEFPEVSAEDIKTYLYVSVYYFSLANQENDIHLKYLKSFIS